MPTATFINLPEEKQKRIMEAAKNEFIQYSFYDASINRIIKEAEISRGAFYMYFTDKEDLFVHLIGLYKGKIAQSIMSKIGKGQYDCFELGLIIFNKVIDQTIEYEAKKILDILMTRVDFHLINHCIDVQNEQLALRLFNEYVKMDRLKSLREEEMIALAEMAITAMITEMIYLSSGKEDIEQARKRLERKFELIKRGVSL